MTPARLVALCLALPLSGAGVLLTATASLAEVTNPGAGAVFGAPTTVGIQATHGASSTQNRLTLTPPGGGEVLVDSAGADRFNGGTLSFGLDTGCWNPGAPASCSGTRPAPNGTWTAKQTGGATDSLSFVLRVPPSAPGGVGADVVSPRQVQVSWRKGAEPDLTGYTVFEGDTMVADGVSAADCSDVCSTVVSYAAEGSGAHSYTVQALRSDGSGGSIGSPRSDAAGATLAPPPPSPQPSSQPASGGGTTGSTGGTGGSAGSGGSVGSGGTPAAGGSSGGASAQPGATAKPGAGRPSSPGGEAPLAVGAASPGSTTAEQAQQAVAQRQAFALSYSSFGPKLGIPKLPPLPTTQAPAVAPLPDGTFEPNLAFPDQVVTERVESRGTAARVTRAVGGAIDKERLLRSTAGALVLLLVAAHLRRWLGSARD